MAARTRASDLAQLEVEAILNFAWGPPEEQIRRRSENKASDDVCIYISGLDSRSRKPPFLGGTGAYSHEV